MRLGATPDELSDIVMIADEAQLAQHDVVDHAQFLVSAVMRANG